MATDVSNPSINGSYDHHQGYNGMDVHQGYNPYAGGSVPSQPASHAAAAATTTAVAAGQTAEIPKDEVGWYFVEQYYTTLSRSPEKLYLFYNKRSQFVSGQETDKVAVCIGQRAINDRIKELDFHDCKVRVTNVDSQASDSNIVIQVIGEISNKSQPHKKFTQTFVLATQTNGYFVLNDIFRYLIEEEVEEAQVPATEEVQQPPAAADGESDAAGSVEHEPKTLTSSTDPAAVEHDAAIVDKELEKSSFEAPSSTAEASEAIALNGAVTPTESPVEAETAVEQAPPPPEALPPKATDLQPEQPKDPEPTPAATPPKSTTPQPTAIPKPVVPKTWASLAASANKPAGSPANASAAPVPAQTKSALQPAKTVATQAPSNNQATSPALAAPAAQRDEPAVPSNEQDEWTSVGGSHGRQQSRQVNTPQHETPQYRGYIKNVHERIDGAALKAAIEKHAEISYFDIARQKNCAFVDFKTAEGYQAVIKANPLHVNGEQLYVEERIVRPGSTPFIPRGQFQGSRGRGNGHQGAPRGNFQGSGRGNYAPRARGGPAPPRGRGAPSAA